MTDKLWEVRLKGKDGIARAAYVAVGESGHRFGARQGGGIDMTKVSELHRRWLEDPAYQAAHQASEAEFDLAHQLISARVAAGLTQEQMAQRMGTTQSAIARLEGGGRLPGLKTLRRLAAATAEDLLSEIEKNGER